MPEPSAEEPEGPPPEPEWKQELNQRLAGYRERRELQRGLHSEDGARDEQTATAAAPIPDRQTAPDTRHIALPPQRRAPRDSPPPLPPPRHTAPPPIVGRLDETALAASLDARPRVMETLLAPLSLRAVAGMMDVTVVLVGLGAFLAVTQGVAAALRQPPPTLEVSVIGAVFCILLAFYWIVYFRYFGRTAGMTWIGLRLLNFDAEPPTALQRRNRAFGAVLSAAALGVGFAWAAADEQRLCWHDRMSKTFVALDDPPG